ncbi:MAG: UvrD-helicase domain-containing protein [Candidatus Paceibacterota bacterium]
MEHLKGLNERQKEAVLQKNGPVLILAGAGAGKTKTITHRILHLIKSGVEPAKILAITFTNKAAKEMRDRVIKLLSEDKSLNFPVSAFPSPSSSFSSPNTYNLTPNTYPYPFLSTFHSLGVHILKENCKLLDLPRHFAIFDKSDSLRAIKEAETMAGIDPKSFDAGRIQSIISKEKGNMVNLSDFEAKISNAYVPKVIAAVWKNYQAILKRDKALDFDDLLLKTANLLKNSREVREHYQNAWQYISVDEYQDTNKVQYHIVKLLAEKDKNLCVVGDPDQNIYNFRGASIKNILDFEKDYPEAKVVLLEENYRSTQIILEVANKIIEKNQMRREKNLFTHNELGQKVGLYNAYDEADEANFVSLRSKQLIESGVNPREIAVLYRANFQSRIMEEAFLEHELPYQVLGTRFFERREVKDVLSYLRASLDQENLSDIKRIINVPARGLGKTSVAKIFSGQENELPAKTLEKVISFRKLLEKIKEKALTEKLSETVKFIVKVSGIEDNLKGSKSEEDQERLENILELVTFSLKYDAMTPEEAVDKFLSEAALQSDQDELEEKRDAVRLMTVHAAKGLEFDYVFVTGLEEDLFPHKKINQENVDQAQEEEERRLFYVALTRARKKIFLSYAGVRTIFGQKQVNVPSEFVFDIDEKFLETEERIEGMGKTIYFD